jgi:hypothetical protein
MDVLKALLFTSRVAVIVDPRQPQQRSPSTITPNKPSPVVHGATYNTVDKQNGIYLAVHNGTFNKTMADINEQLSGPKGCQGPAKKQNRPTSQGAGSRVQGKSRRLRRNARKLEQHESSTAECRTCKGKGILWWQVNEESRSMISDERRGQRSTVKVGIQGI